MKSSGLWSALLKGLRSGNKAHRRAAGRFQRSTQDPAEGAHASRVYAASRGKNIPGLFRYNTYNKQIISADRAKGRGRVSIFTSDVLSTHSTKSWHEDNTCLEGPIKTNNPSALRESYDVLSAAFSKWPSAQFAMATSGCGWVDSPLKWKLICTRSRHGHQGEMKNVASFMLRVTFDEIINTITSLSTASKGIKALVEVELQLRPTHAFFLADGGEFNDRPTQTTDDVVAELVYGLRQALLGRKFTSLAAWNEAAVQHLGTSFHQSILGTNVELENINLNIDHRVALKGVQGTSIPSRFIHEQSHSERNSYVGFPRRLPLSCVSRQRHPTREADILAKDHREHVQVLLPPYNLDISAASHPHLAVNSSDIASRFEEGLTGQLSMDLPSVLDSFLTVLRSLPRNAADSVVVTISREACKSSADLPRPVQQPVCRMELKKASQPETFSVVVHVDLQRSFRLRFNDAEQSDLPILVRQILFKMSPIDATSASSLLQKPANERVSISREMSHLIESASNTLNKVCDGVRFDDVAAIPGMLAEAVLRVVHPLNVGCTLQEISLEMSIGDDPVFLNSTVSIEDLSARLRSPRSYRPSLNCVGSSSDHVSGVVHTSKRGAAERTGFDQRALQLITSSATAYSSIDFATIANSKIHTSLQAPGPTNIPALQYLLGGLLEQTPEVKEAVLLFFRKNPENDLGILNPTKSNWTLAVFSHGEIFCLLPAFTHVYIGHDSYLNGQLLPVLVEIWLRGASSQQANEDVNAWQQMALLHEILASKLTALIDGLVFRTPDESASRISEVVLEAKDELAEHIIVDFASVEVNIYEVEEDIPSGSAHNLGTSTDVNSADPDRSDQSVEGGNSTPHETSMHPLSASKPEYEHAATVLRELLQDLDLKLLSSASKSAERTDIVDGAVPSTQVGPNAQRSGKMERGVVIALGSNVGNRVEEIEKACRAIDADPDMRIVDTSFLYETKPMYVEDQERFVNGACEIETSLSPIQLLDRLQAIEQGHGRVKLVDKGPRNIDLDIAIFRDEVVKSERLTVPHMLMHEREFVLKPLMDLENMREWRHPRTKNVLPGMFGYILNPKHNTLVREPMHTVMPLTTDTLIHPLDPCRGTRIMSILNTTPDSFSDGGSNTLDMQSLRETVASHIAGGATIIDVGGQSSRPNAPDVTAEEEISRVLPAIAAIKSLPEAEGVSISVDTYRAAVAEAAVNAGAHIVNDISAGMMDPQMLSTVARLGCTYIMMHMRGTPATMQSPENCTYDGDIRTVIREELSERVALAVASGVRRWRIILDPGVGFAKNQDQNLRLLYNPIVVRNWKGRSVSKLEKDLRSFPQLFGCSRKSFIGNITGVTEPKDRIWGTASAVTASINSGADIVRVHDIKEMAQVAKMADAIYRVEGNLA